MCVWILNIIKLSFFVDQIEWLWKMKCYYRRKAVVGLSFVQIVCIYTIKMCVMFEFLSWFRLFECKAYIFVEPFRHKHTRARTHARSNIFKNKPIMDHNKVNPKNIWKRVPFLIFHIQRKQNKQQTFVEKFTVSTKSRNRNWDSLSIFIWPSMDEIYPKQRRQQQKRQQPEWRKYQIEYV